MFRFRHRSAYHTHHIWTESSPSYLLSLNLCNNFDSKFINLDFGTLCVKRFAMGIITTITVLPTMGSVVLLILASIIAAALFRIVYSQFFHPLSKFPGPWYATSFSLVHAIISVKKKEPEFLMYLVNKYGSKFTFPFLLFFVADFFSQGKQRSLIDNYALDKLNGVTISNTVRTTQYQKSPPHLPAYLTILLYRIPTYQNIPNHALLPTCISSKRHILGSKL
jgi:hypothetical protein